MRNMIFVNSSSFIYNEVIIYKILEYKKQNNLKNYQLLESNTLSGGYYGGSKEIASQTMSRILHDKKKLSDGLVEIITENMGISKNELFIEPIIQNKFNSYHPFYQELFYQILNDSLLSDEYCLQTKELLIEYIPIAKIMFDKKKYEAKDLLSENELRSASAWIFARIHNFLIDNNYNFGLCELINNYLSQQDLSIRKLHSILNNLYLYLFDDIIKKYRNENSMTLGLRANELLKVIDNIIIECNTKFETNNELFSSSQCKNDYMKLKKKEIIYTESYIDHLEHLQLSLDRAEGELQKRKISALKDFELQNDYL